MAEANLDAVIRQTAKQQNKTLMAAVKAGRDRYLALAAKAKDKVGKERFKQLAADAMEQGTAAARRLQMSADNAADSYARSMRMASDAFNAKADAEAAKPAPVKKEAAPKPVDAPKKAAKPKVVKAKKAAKKSKS
ncbi:MAG: hypothetical protein ABWY18_15080 [Tardiphaga sp.]